MNFNFTNTNEQKRLSLMCVDQYNNTQCSIRFKNMLEQLNYIVDINKEQPEFLIFDVYGCEHNNHKYNKSIKIATYSENIIPDFSETDYSLSQAHIIYLDRYFKYPSFIWRLYDIINYKAENIFYFSKSMKKTKFCAAVISHCKNNTLFRFLFIKQLNKYKHVDMGGSCLNDVGGKIKDKNKFLSSYKFSIAMENSDGDGYLSEKIIDSLKSGTIPIYYGDYLIDEYINPKIYILVKGEKDIQTKIEYIKKIDNDDKLYNSILKEPIFINDNHKQIIKNTQYEKHLFLTNIFLQNKQNAKRVDNSNSFNKMIINNESIYCQ